MDRACLHDQVVDALKLYVPGDQGGFGEVVSEILDELEKDGIAPTPDRIDEYCRYFVSQCGKVS